MNEGAARACRADRRLTGRKGKIPRDMKRAWREMSQRDRAKLRRRWRAAQHDIGVIGEFKSDLRKASVQPADLKL